MNDKKIGILTFHNAINYGANIQAFALQHTLKKMNKNVEIIDYRSVVLQERYKLFNVKQAKFSNIKSILRFYVINFYKWMQYRSFRKFWSQNYCLSKTIHESDFHSYCNSRYEKIIVGSDQVWNYTLTNFDKKYFLHNINAEKYSYAASFGIRNIVDDAVEAEYSFLLKDFKNISVRENTGVDLLSQMSLVAEQNIDPSLLLPKYEWESIISHIKPVINQKFVFVYTIGGNKELYDAAIEYANERGLIIVQPENLPRGYKNIHLLRGLSPLQWIWCVNNAECIFTNSFHGVALSICLNKDFFVQSSQTNYQETKSRIESLLELTNITQRYISEKRHIEIDWPSVNETLNNERKKSLNYLAEVIKH